MPIAIFKVFCYYIIRKRDKVHQITRLLKMYKNNSSNLLNMSIDRFNKQMYNKDKK